MRFGNSPEEAEGDMVSGNFFSGLGIRIARGRGFTDDDETHHSPIVVLSYNYWTRRFSRAPGVLGQTLFVKGVPLTIVGVTAQGFEGTEPGNSVDFWVPLQSRAELNAWGNGMAKPISFVRTGGVCVFSRVSRPALARSKPSHKPRPSFRAQHSSASATCTRARSRPSSVSSLPRPSPATRSSTAPRSK